MSWVFCYLWVKSSYLIQHIVVSKIKGNGDYEKTDIKKNYEEQKYNSNLVNFLLCTLYLTHKRPRFSLFLKVYATNPKHLWVCSRFISKTSGSQHHPCYWFFILVKIHYIYGSPPVLRSQSTEYLITLFLPPLRNHWKMKSIMKNGITNILPFQNYRTF